MKDETQEPTPTYPVGVWITSADKTNLLYARTQDFKSTVDDRFPTIKVDTTQVFQTVDGFGYTLTGGSAKLLRNIAPAERNAFRLFTKLRECKSSYCLHANFCRRISE